MKFTIDEQRAVLKAIDKVVLADDRAYEEEANFVLQMASLLRFKMELVREARHMDYQEALRILQAMSISKKETLATMLRETAGADGRITEEELELVQEIIAEVGLD
ncbi:TerB family tellurite resistance protein [Robiginitalea sp. SC105]|uniref:TerB family tellurite resistance protein n=1 Tax=Robiginitalea sp. SC105 TaxID=2762332 RepID=UPI00163A63AC|nr:TerB family tellurite resistance protein [Robiginitalea sp. SC105]MBC2838564.1 TerB family tellurite resistance protein [Robiginitalea sp. SC105]